MNNLRYYEYYTQMGRKNINIIRYIFLWYVLLGETLKHFTLIFFTFIQLKLNS